VPVARPEARPTPEPGAEPAAQTVPEARDELGAQVWNLWDLERLAEAMETDARAEERGLLLLHLREFADPAGDLPPEFDPLVRDVFGEDVTELVT